MRMPLLLTAISLLGACAATEGDLPAEEVHSAVVPLDLAPEEFTGRSLSLRYFEAVEEDVVERSLPITAEVTPEGWLAFDVEDALLPDLTYHVMAEPRTPEEDELRVATFLTDSGAAIASAGGDGDKADGFERPVIDAALIDRVIVVRPPPEELTGNFNLDRTSPEHLSTTVPRNVDYVMAQFKDETIDCAATTDALFWFALNSEVTGVQNHLFRKYAITDPSHHDYRGHFECDAARNQLVFFLPGYLYGNAWYRASLPVVSTAGSRRTFTLRFKTQNPGLRVDLGMVESHKNECADDTWRWWNDEVKRCDVYLMGAVSVEGRMSSTPVKLPDPAGETTWGNIVRNTPTHVDSPTVFSDGAPIGAAVRVDIVGMDRDDNSARDNVQALGGVLTALGPWVPPAGVAGGIVTAGASFIPTNDNDLLATMQIHLTDNVQRWGTTDHPSTSQPYYYLGRKYTSPNGNISIWLRTEEWPRTWQPQPPLL